MVSFLEDMMLTEIVLEVAEMLPELKAAKEELESKGVSDRTAVLAVLSMLVEISYVAAKEVVANGNDPIDIAVCAQIVTIMTLLLDMADGFQNESVSEKAAAEKQFEEIF